MLKELLYTTINDKDKLLEVTKEITESSRIHVVDKKKKNTKKDKQRTKQKQQKRKIWTKMKKITANESFHGIV